jgi:hypothetical protein
MPQPTWDINMLFADMIPMVEKSFEGLSETKYAEFDRMLNISHAEWTMFHEKKSLAQADGRMDLDNAMWVYNTLGGSVEVFNKQPAAVKYLMTEIFKRLLQPEAV